MTSRYGRAAGLVGFSILGTVLAVALLAPVLSPSAPNAQDLANRLQAPTWRGPHWLGTDSLGRDLLSRIIYGTRLSLVVGLTSVVLAGTVGATLGMLAAYVGGWVDDAVMRFAEVQLSFPSFLLAIFIAAVLGPSLRNVILVLTVSGWVIYARVIRSQVLAEKRLQYVEAAHAMGAGARRVMGRHLLPNVLSPVVVVAATSVGAMITTEAALSFLGLGVPASIATLGSVLADGRDYILVAWWPTTLPGVAISIMVLSVNLVGDWVQRRTFRGR